MHSLLRLLLSTSRAPANTRTARPSSCRPTLEALEDRLVPSAASTISAGFNGTPIKAGNTVWFSSVGKVSGLGSAPATIQVVNGEIDFTANGANYDVSVPNASITFDPSATTATTTFDAVSQSWVTTLPTKFVGNAFVAGVALPVPGGLPGGIKPVSWTATFQSATAGLHVTWQWGAAVYTHFSTDYTTVNVNAVDAPPILLLLPSPDRAGTPENFKGSLTGGATESGLLDYTGNSSASASASVAQVSPSASLAGVVTDTLGNAVAGVTITLTGTTSSGQQVALTTTTAADGSYSFTGLLPGTYALMQTTTLSGEAVESASVGTVNGTADGAQTMYGAAVGSINLGAGNNGVNYNFLDSFAGS